MKQVLIAAGGTGGHIFPAIVIAQALQQQNIAIHWLASDAGLEKFLLTNQFQISYIQVQRLRGKNFFKKISALWNLLQGILQARSLIKKISPDLVIVMGGFVSGPAGIAAKLLKKPLIVHEQNAIAGLSNRILAKWAYKILAAYPQAFSPKMRVEVVGNPVRSSIINLPHPQQRIDKNNNSLRILILGGSQGAKAINQKILQTVQVFPQKDRLDIWHQTGQSDFQATQAGYQAISVKAKVEAFIEDVTAAYGWADFIICRAGALTVAEIAAAGVASLLIPFPYAVDNHQWHNAAYLATANAAILISEKEITIDYLVNTLSHFLNNRVDLLNMASRARALSHPDATNEIVNICLSNL